MAGRVVLCPGHVASLSDRQVHYIGARALAACYAVPFDKCVVYDATHPALSWRPSPLDVCLYPDPHGDYALPDAARQLLGLKG